MFGLLMGLPFLSPPPPALRVGADLVHVFTVESAALAIKTYSPDLMVHPSLPEPRAIGLCVCVCVYVCVSGARLAV